MLYVACSRRLWPQLRIDDLKAVQHQLSDQDRRASCPSIALSDQCHKPIVTRRYCAKDQRAKENRELALGAHAGSLDFFGAGAAQTVFNLDAGRVGRLEHADQNFAFGNFGVVEFGLPVWQPCGDE